jgi:hypothetical protein
VGIWTHPASTDPVPIQNTEQPATVSRRVEAVLRHENGLDTPDRGAGGAFQPAFRPVSGKKGLFQCSKPPETQVRQAQAALVFYSIF